MKKQTDPNEVKQMGREVARRRSVGNPAMTGDAIDIEPNDNVKYIMQSLKIANLPTIDLHDPVAVQTRINEYFTIVAENGMKPTVAGLGNALNGMDRRRLWEIRTGATQGRGDIDTLPFEVRDVIKRAYKIMEDLWENYMQNGKINPVSGIFLGKNNFGYQDKQEMVLTPNTQNESDFNEDDLRKRYMIEDGESND